MYSYNYRPMIHTPECLREWADGQAELRDYLAMWPKFCKHCNGSGGYDIPASRWEPADYEWCGSCILANHCPRCAQPLPQNAFDVQWLYCDICDWMESRTPHAPVSYPYGDPCECEWAKYRDPHNGLLEPLPFD